MIIKKDASGNTLDKAPSIRQMANRLNISHTAILKSMRKDRPVNDRWWFEVVDEELTATPPMKKTKVGVRITGVTPQHDVDFEKEILPLMMKVGHRAQQKNKKEETATIEIRGSQPFAVAFMSDVHGGGKTDYEAIKNDVDIIRGTDDMWSILAGDLTDNFIIGKLQSVQKHQPLPMDYEHRFVEWFLDSLKDSLIAFVSGNHDVWTHKTSAYDHLRHILSEENCLFDQNQVQFTFKYFDQEQKWLVRHKFKHNSIFNPTHGIEVAWERLGIDFDVAIAGHTHIAPLHRPFIKHDKVRHAILLGTYKIRDEFATEIGFAKSHGRGSGALVYHPDGRDPLWCADLQTARDVLAMYKDQCR